jgi:hypothetical protein
MVSMVHFDFLQNRRHGDGRYIAFNIATGKAGGMTHATLPVMPIVRNRLPT